MSDQFKCPECSSLGSPSKTHDSSSVVCKVCGAEFQTNPESKPDPAVESSISTSVANAIERIDELFDGLDDGPEILERDFLIPEKIGNYVVLKQIGVGAFSSVYLAHDSTLDRNVAIKIPRRLTLSNTQRKRLLREARMAARLSHAGIVSVHEVIEGDDTVFIVSDFVEGETLDRWLRKHSRSLEEKVMVFRSLCDAVAYAHQNKIVHRDLKPSNIIIDDQGNPYVLDFGLARQLDEESSLTVEGRIVGTPAYMSPEQAEGDQQSVTPKSDVYSLGVILYELLTGIRPFQGSTERIVFQLIHELPAVPSKLNSAVPKPLETICLKALHKDPLRRYPTASEVADDLLRWTNDHPIKAQPIGAVERFVLWKRRNPQIALLSISVAMLLIIGITVTSFLSIWALDERDNANESKAATLIALEATEIAKDEAERNFQEARRTVDEFYRIVSRTTLLDQPGTTELRRQLLERARDFYEKYLEGRSADKSFASDLVTARLELASVLELLEQTTEAIAEYRRVVDLLEPIMQNQNPSFLQYVQYVSALGNVAKLSYVTGDIPTAKASYERAFTAYEALRAEMLSFPEQTTTIDHRLTIASILNNYGEFQAAQGDLKGSRQTYTNTKDLCASISDSSSPETLLVQHSQAQVGHAYALFESGKTDEAILELNTARASLSAAIEDSDFGVDLFNVFVIACNDLSYCLSRSADSETSIQVLLDLRRVTEEVVAKFPGVLVFKDELATQLNNLGAIYHESGYLDDAIKYLEQATEIRKELANRNPQLSDYLRGVANSQNNVAMCLFERGEIDDAIVQMNESLDSFEQLSKRTPESSEFKSLLGIAHSNASHRLSQLKRFEESHKHATKAVLVFRALVDSVPDVISHQTNLAWSLANQSRAIAEMDLSRARELSEESLKIYRNLEQEHPQLVDVKMLMSSAVEDASRFSLRVGSLTDALRFQTEAIAILTELTEFYPANARYHERRIDMHAARVKTIDELKDYQNREEIKLEFDAAMTAYLKSFAPRVSQVKAHALNLKQLATVEARNQEYVAANEYLERAIGFYERLIQVENPELINQRDYAVCYTELGLNYLDLDQYEDAVAAFEHGHDFLLTIEKDNPMFFPILADRLQVTIALGNAHLGQGNATESGRCFREVVRSCKEFFESKPSIPLRFNDEITSYSAMAIRGEARSSLDNGMYEMAIRIAGTIVDLIGIDGFHLASRDIEKTIELLDEISESASDDDLIEADTLAKLKVTYQKAVTTLNGALEDLKP